MYQVILDDDNLQTFKVGPTINACTKVKNYFSAYNNTIFLNLNRGYGFILKHYHLQIQNFQIKKFQLQIVKGQVVQMKVFLLNIKINNFY